jgi:large subunit ribosomal protein L31
MKPDIHPQYAEINVVCSCGHKFKTRSTVSPDLHVEVSSSCHPIYTGQQTIEDSAGHVHQFRTRYAKN